MSSCHPRIRTASHRKSGDLCKSAGDQPGTTIVPKPHSPGDSHRDGDDIFESPTQLHTDHIIGMEADESRALLDELHAHTTRPEFVYRHKWRLGDLLMWDNCAVQHKAVFDYDPTLRRVMQRCTIEGSVPF